MTQINRIKRDKHNKTFVDRFIGWLDLEWPALPTKQMYVKKSPPL